MNPDANNPNANGAGQRGCYEDPRGPWPFPREPDPDHEHLLWMTAQYRDSELNGLPELSDVEVFEDLELNYPVVLSTWFGSEMDTDFEHCHGSSVSLVSPLLDSMDWGPNIFSMPELDSVDSRPTISSMPEQGEDPEGTGANSGARSGVDGLPCRNIPAAGDSLQHLDSVNAESSISVHQGNPVLPATIAATEKRVPFNVAASDINPGRPRDFMGAADWRVDRFKSAKEKKKSCVSWACEIRISRKIPMDPRKDKLWVGTFPTECQKARAMDVGRYLLSDKRITTPPETAFETHSPTFEELRKFKGRLREQPLTAEGLQRVKELARHYGTHGSLQGILF